ncbi:MULTISPECIES: STAS domain-containing protein [unclassified Streptomyces]|uniref:STAS domain-containing protein n=1 Tax=unclassified Streptomyces TaxID=2593676 RepID=UPI0033DFE3D6
MDSAGAGASDGRFSVTGEWRGEVAVLALSGELDHDTAEPLREALAEAVAQRPARIVVDCGELGFCDSTGLNVLLHARLEAQEAGCTVEVAALRQPVARMFEITGAHGVFRVHTDLDAALVGGHPA